MSDNLLDWSALSPHQPLLVGDPLYQARSAGGAAEIDGWLAAGRRSVIVVGPVGVGKSTELAQAVALGRERGVCVLVQLDRLTNVRKLTGDALLSRMAAALVEHAVEELGLELPDEILPSRGAASLISHSSNQRWIRLAISAVASADGRDQVTFFVDGLEKAPRDVAADCFSTLADVAAYAPIASVAPWHAAYGPESAQVVAESERLVSIRALSVEEEDERRLLASILEVRMPWLIRVASAVAPASTQDLTHDLVDAISESGGIPRTLLQLVADACSYASLAGRPWPTRDDTALAIADQRDSMRRLLLPGDTDAIRASYGTDGRELALDRKIRLLSHGLLLERTAEDGGGSILVAHPLLDGVV